MTDFDELTAVALLREQVASGQELAQAERVLTAEIRSALASQPHLAIRSVPGRRRRVILGVAVASALAIAISAVVVPWASRTPGSHRPAAKHQVGPIRRSVAHHQAVRSKTQLVRAALTVADVAPRFAPGPHKWTYIEWETAAPAHGPVWAELHGPPYRRAIQQIWVRVDRRELAVLQDGKAVTNPNVGEPSGWSDPTYKYLDSLPVNPAKLEAVIAANVSRLPTSRLFDTAHAGLDAAIFQAVEALLENVVVPPLLLAALYGVLARLRSVRFDPSVTDFSGRTGIGLYLILEGYLKQELIVNPVTFALLGIDSVAVRAHTTVGTDVTDHYAKGQVVSMAAISMAIVSRPGERVR